MALLWAAMAMPWQPMARLHHCHGVHSNGAACHGIVMGCQGNAMPCAIVAMPWPPMAAPCIHHGKPMASWRYHGPFIWHPGTTTGRSAVMPWPNTMVFFMACHETTCRATPWHGHGYPWHSHGIVMKHHGSSWEPMKCQSMPHGECRDAPWKSQIRDIPNLLEPNCIQ